MASHAFHLHTKKGSRSRASGLTLVEVIVATLIIGLSAGGILSGLLLSRRFTETAIRQNVATNVVQGYIEQIKAISWGSNFITELPLSLASGTSGKINTMLESGTTDDLNVSNLPVPNLSSLTPGVAPTGAIDNIKTITINSTNSVTMPVNVWVWIESKPSASNSSTKLKAITIIYTWEAGVGANKKKYINSLRTMCSDVPTI
jgi:type II secretory pathway pseudopilin PulG